jgi:hypothetical protein
VLLLLAKPVFSLSLISSLRRHQTTSTALAKCFRRLSRCWPSRLAQLLHWLAGWRVGWCIPVTCSLLLSIPPFPQGATPKRRANNNTHTQPFRPPALGSDTHTHFIYRYTHNPFFSSLQIDSQEIRESFHPTKAEMKALPSHRIQLRIALTFPPDRQLLTCIARPKTAHS